MHLSSFLIVRGKLYIIYNNFINNKEVNTSLLFSFAISQTHTLLVSLSLLTQTQTIMK